MRAGLRIRRRAPVEYRQDAWPAAVPALLRRLYAARGAIEPALALPRLAALHPPELLGGLDLAVGLLADAIAGGRHIVVTGDFDCDGATACALAVRGLRMLGARKVTPAVPNRMVHGYGLSPGMVEDLAALRPDLLMTVDHGVACHSGVAAARARGWQVLVTDHHLPGPHLPDADAIVNPNLAGDGFPSKALAGVGVVFYVLLALRRRLRELGAFAEAPGEPDLGVLLDLVAVGTIADLVPLDANNRALVAAGLRRLRSGAGNPGLQALVEVSRRSAATLTAADIGFAVAPRLNAAGRLEDMAQGIECLLCDEPARARSLAERLDRINAERREVQQHMTDAAEAALTRRVFDFGPTSPPAHCLHDPDWHPGVVGLVASKLKERLHRPVVAFAPAEPGGQWLRGSARSIAGFHIRDALAAIDAAHPGLIERFGGHAMAAGLSLHGSRLAAFETAFVAQAGHTLDAAMLQAEILSDGELLPVEFDRRHAEALRDGGPWGPGFPEPVFDGAFEVLEWRRIGERHLRMSLRHPSHGGALPAIHFNGWQEEPPARRLHLAYRLQPDDYRGGDAIQLVVEHRQAC